MGQKVVSYVSEEIRKKVMFSFYTWTLLYILLYSQWLEMWFVINVINVIKNKKHIQVKKN